MSTERTSSHPQSFTHADFLTEVAKSGIETIDLTQRPEPASTELDLQDLARGANTEKPERFSVDPDIYHTLMLLDFTTHPGQPDNRMGIDVEAYLKVTRQWLEPQIDRIRDILTVEQLEAFWNQHLPAFVENRRDQTGLKGSFLDMVGLTYSVLLQDCLKEGQSIELQVPESMNRVAYLGTGLRQGNLIVEGNVGNAFASLAGGTASFELYGNAGESAGFTAGGQATILINGSVGPYLGVLAGGSSRIEVTGNASDMAGSDAGDFAEIIIRGNAGDKLGENARGGRITVIGNVGDNAGYNAGGDAYILIQGNAGDWVGNNIWDPATIEVKGSVSTLGTNVSGNIIIGGVDVYRDGTRII